MAYQSYPPPFQAPYFQPIPPPLDPFRGYYADRLRELTFNSRPIIQDLSVTAMAQRDQNNWEGMRAVVEEIEVATLRALPHQKLPLLYLIDSISKNIGPPYTTHLLPPIVPRLYLKTYREVDGVTKAKMEEMIGLWRTSGMDGGDLYGQGVRETIERDIFGSMGYQRQALPTRDRVMSTLHATLEAKHRESAAQPWNRTAVQQVNVLVQIGELLNTTQVSPQELQQIMEQLKSMGPSSTAQQPPNFAVVPSLPSSVPVIPRPPVPLLPPFPPSLHSDPYGALPRPSQVSAVPTPLRMTSTPIPPSTPIPFAPAPVQATTSLLSGIPANVADILRNLNTTGVLSHPRTPDSLAAKREVVSALENYENMIITLDVRLDSLDLNQMHTLPTSHMPQRCKQCGMRFPDGDSKMQAHLDWHFRRNRKERETEGRGAHRRWLPRAEEWINETGSTDAGPSKSPTKAQSGANIHARLTAERVAALQRKWVRVPGDSSKAGTPCPICKEVFKSEWSDEEEEWVWRNAVEVNATVYHATCRAEQMSSVVAARLLATEPRARSASRSPKGTPQPELPRTGPSAMKRKAEEEDGEAKRVKIESVEENLDMPIPLVNGIQTEAPVKLEMPEELVEDEHEIQVIPPTPESGTKTNENEIVASLDEVEEKGINGGGDHDGDERMSIQEGSEEREFEPDLEVELDPEPEETS